MSLCLECKILMKSAYGPPVSHLPSYPPPQFLEPSSRRWEGEVWEEQWKSKLAAGQEMNRGDKMESITSCGPCLRPSLAHIFGSVLPGARSSQNVITTYDTV